VSTPVSTSVNTTPDLGDLVRYIEPSTSKFRIGYVVRHITRGEHKGCVVVMAAARDAKKSTVNPSKVKLVGRVA
jgi:hypothetical protein